MENPGQLVKMEPESMPTDPTLAAAIVSAVVALITSIIGASAMFFIQKDRLRTELKLEFATETAVRELLSDERWTFRTFEAIQKRFQGFEPDELRKCLIRSGALSFEGEGKEMWGLRERNREKLG